MKKKFSRMDEVVFGTKTNVSALPLISCEKALELVSSLESETIDYGNKAMLRFHVLDRYIKHAPACPVLTRPSFKKELRLED